METNPQLDSDIESWLELQRIWSAQVTPVAPDVLKSLYLKGLLFFARGAQGEVVGSFYKKPLARPSLFRWGGFVTNGLPTCKLGVIDLHSKQTKLALANNERGILQTSNSAVIRHLQDSAWTFASFEEAMQDPHRSDLLNAYVKDSPKSWEYYSQENHRYGFLGLESLNGNL